MEIALVSITNAREPEWFIILPFALMLLAMAVMPFRAPHWWERQLPKVAIGLGAITTAYYLFVLHNPARILHVAYEYASFIALIGSLFIVAGGIHIEVKGEAKPMANCIFLVVGAVLTNLIGTTGASVLLIRPWIQMNRYRITAFHIVFFIFIISNIGGCLTPMGPPLFLGYLKGVPFWWVLRNCWNAWIIIIAFLIAIFYVIDRQNYRRAPHEVRRDQTRREIWTIEGWRNVVFLALILVAVFVRHPIGLSEAMMLIAAAGSWFATPKRIHQLNAFNFHPMREVAWLFAGIFATMVPALDLLEKNATSLGLDSEMKFFWLSGLLSAALDNAPTYLAFLSAATGLHHLSLNDPEHVRQFVTAYPYDLVAISLGAVFFGALTYIGNGPNLLVMAIAANAKVRMPGFFGYIWKFALPILIPILLLISLLFFSR